jgi:hypothetical protein
MKLKEADFTVDRIILTHLIISKEYLEITKPFLKEHYFEVKAIRTIYRWCHDYYNEHSDSPGRHIMDVYIQNEPNLDDDEKVYLTGVLTKLSGEWEKRKEAMNLSYVIKRTIEWCKIRHAAQINERLSVSIKQQNVEGIEAAARELQLEILEEEKEETNPFLDTKRWKEAFSNQQQEILFTLPSVWGEFMSEQLYRESFVAFLAPEKTGKSFMLQELGMQALREGLNVAVFECGDLTKLQRYRRWAQYLTGRPLRRLRKDDPPDKVFKINYPLDFEGDVEVKELHNLTDQVALEAVEKWARRCEKRGGGIRLACYDNTTLTFKEMKRQLAEWEKEGFVPDVIIDDFLDIHAPENPKLDFRHQEIQKWKIARSISQHYHCCFITATQADAASYDKEHIGKKNFSESKDKYGQVTAIYAMNRTEEDEEMQQVRLSPLFIREGDKKPEIKILQCLAIGRPYVRSDWVGGSAKKKAERKKVEQEPKRGRPKSGNAAKAEELLKRDLMSVAEIAAETGLSENRVHEIKRELKENGELCG